MFEKALVGSRRYWGLVIGLLVIAGIGFIFYLQQLKYGLVITGMSRDVSWGLYIANFTFLVGVAASAVMVVLPYYLHNYKEFGKITVLGEFLAVAAVVMTILFIIVDLGQPGRLFNMILHPSPRSVMFWDMVCLSGYLLLNIFLGWIALDSERKGEPPPRWIKPFIFLSIPWAISIHTVTAFIYQGLAARPFWLTALLAPRFLATAFASGPALLLLFCFIMKRFTKFDPGKRAFETLAQIIAYAMCIHIFFLLVEFYTVFYSQLPKHMIHFFYLLYGLEGYGKLVPWIWASIAIGCLAIYLLLNPDTRRKETTLGIAAVAVVVSVWIEKGLGLVVPGFIPSPTGEIFEYWPTGPEILITLGVWAVGFLILTLLYKIAISVKEEIA